MNDDAASAKPVRPTWRQALVMLGGGTLLASSACYGVFEYENRIRALANTFSVLFAAGMVLVLVGVIMIIVRSAKPSMHEPAALTPSPRPAWSQVLIMLASGVVLGASSCFGFLGALRNMGDNLFGPFATGFYIGCLVALGGLIMALIRLVRSLRKSVTKNV